METELKPRQKKVLLEIATWKGSFSARWSEKTRISLERLGLVRICPDDKTSVEVTEDGAVRVSQIRKARS